MTNLDPGVLVTIVTIVAGALAITVGTIVPTWAEGRAVVKALEGMARQPEIAGEIRTSLLISMALLGSASIYVLLVVLILIFANPLIDRFIGG